MHARAMPRPRCGARANTPERVNHAMPVDLIAVEATRDDIIRRWRAVISDAG